MMLATCVPWPYASRAPALDVKSKLATIRPRSDRRDADAFARVTADRGDAPLPDLVGANRLRRHGHRPAHRHVAGEVGDVRVGAERRELAGRHLEHGPAAQQLLDLHAVPGGNRAHV